jgi:hypothetical protein
MRRTAHRAVAISTAALMLAGCVTTQTGRIGADDGTDPCRTQLVALDSTGDYFAEDILKGAAIGAVGGALIGAAAGGDWRSALIGAGIGAAAGAAGGYLVALQRQSTDQASLFRTLSADIDRENAQLDRTQLAFNQLVDCRMNSANTIRRAHREGRLDRTTAQAQLQQVQARLRNDVAVAQRINEGVGKRGGEFDTALESVSPGVKGQVQTARALASARPRGQTVALRATPNSQSPQIASITARDNVTVKPATGGFVLVETSGGARGYAPAEQFSAQGVNLARASASPPPAGGDARNLAASNIARRDNFADSIGSAERLAQGGGFELAS